jgi:hypothetical protein
MKLDLGHGKAFCVCFSVGRRRCMESELHMGNIHSHWISRGVHCEGRGRWEATFNGYITGTLGCIS